MNSSIMHFVVDKIRQKDHFRANMVRNKSLESYDYELIRAFFQKKDDLLAMADFAVKLRHSRTEFSKTLNQVDDWAKSEFGFCYLTAPKRIREAVNRAPSEILDRVASYVEAIETSGLLNAAISSDVRAMVDDGKRGGTDGGVALDAAYRALCTLVISHPELALKKHADRHPRNPDGTHRT
jgi:hypothetical protein